MSKFVNPFTDIGFKITFGQPASKSFLITLLNELLAGEHYITDLTFLDKEDHSENVSDKGIIYDLYCRTDNGGYIIVEMQNRWHRNFLDRTLYYMCRAISRQVESPSSREVGVPEDSMIVSEPVAPYGMKYKLPPVYGVFLMNFKEPELEGKFRTDTVIADRDTGKVVNPHLRQIYLQFPYFTKELAECTTLYERLIYALKNMNNWNRMPDALKEQVFEHLARLAAVANLSEENRIAYDKALDRYRVEQLYEEGKRESEEERIREEERLRRIKEDLEREKEEMERKKEEVKHEKEEVECEKEEVERKKEEVKHEKEEMKREKEEVEREKEELRREKEELLRREAQAQRESTLGIARHLKEIGLDAAAIHKATGLTLEEIQRL